jgi:glucose/arabinose dehydrogenase
MSNRFQRRGFRLLATAVGLLVPSATAASVAPAAAGAPVTAVMSGLHNPRGLAFGPEGALYVVEAGSGGDGPCVQGPFGQTLCYGPTGTVRRLARGALESEVVATGLPSVTSQNGAAQAGPTDISFLGRGGAYVTVGLQANPARRAEFGEAGAGLGQLVHVPASGKWRFVADLAGYEALVNPDPRLVDSNPYGVLAEPGGRIVADAGGNSLLRVGANGDISTLAVLPPVAAARNGDAVPTSVVVGPDGAYYVGVLTGAPFADGAASVYRVVPSEEPEIFATGFKAIIDIAFDEAGNLYVLQHATGATMLMGPGMLIRVAPDGTRAEVLTQLQRPTSVAIGPDGAVYVSNRGTSNGAGEVLRVEP